MSGPQPAPPPGDREGPGILGNLPRTRPAVRSPRRAAARPPEAEPEAETADEGGEPPGGAEPEQAAPDAPADSGRTREQELEELARAGLSLAGGAATLGLRAAGRAAARLRGAVERR